MQLAPFDWLLLVTLPLNLMGPDYKWHVGGHPRGTRRYNLCAPRTTGWRKVDAAQLLTVAVQV